MAGASKRKGSSLKRTGKRMRRSSMALSTKNIAHAKFERASWVTNWPFNTASVAGYYRYIQPTFSDIYNSGEYTTLFDSYRVNKIKVTVIPRFGDTNCNFDNTGAPVAYNNQFYMTIGSDKNFTGTATGTYSSATYNGMLEKCDNIRTYKLDKPFSWTYTPNIQNATSVGTSVMKCPWMLTSSATQPLLGYQAFIHDVNFSALATNSVSVDILYTFYFECKGNR